MEGATHELRAAEAVEPDRVLVRLVDCSTSTRNVDGAMVEIGSREMSLAEAKLYRNRITRAIRRAARV